MVAISILSCTTFSSDLKFRPSPPPPSNSLLSRRHLLFRPTSISPQSSSLQVEMQSSSANKFAIEPISQEETNKITSGENSSASTDNGGLSLSQFFTLDNIPTWAKFILGSAVFLAIPILRKTYTVKDVTKKVEEAAEFVEKAAEVTEKLAEEIAEALPEGRLKEAVVKLEKIALLVDKEAEFTESIIEKIGDVIEAVDTKVKVVEVEISKKNDKVDSATVKMTVVDQFKEDIQ